MKKSIILFFAVMFAIVVAVPLSWSAESDYYGVYTGTYIGDDQGVWVAYFNAGGAAWLSYSTVVGYGDGGYGSFGAESPASINFSAWNIDSDTYGSGTIQADGTVAGSWIDYWADPDDTGTFNGNLVLSCSQQGNYSGIFSGDSDGTWTMTIGADGHITGEISDGTDNFSFEGGIDPGSGNFIVIGSTPDGDFVVYGSVDGNGSVSGGWHTENDAESGTITSGSGGGGGGGGGGGCFLITLVR